MVKVNNITNIADEIIKLQKTISDKNVEQAIKHVSENEVLRALFGYNEMNKHVEHASKVLSPQALYLYLHFINSHDMEIASKEMSRKIKEEGYNYQEMFDRIMNTLSKFSPKQQDYILLKSIDVAAQVMNNQIIQKLIMLSNSKANTIILLLELFRMIEPFLIRTCQEVIQGVTSSKQIDEFLNAQSLIMRTASINADTIIEKMDMDKRKEGEEVVNGKENKQEVAT